MVWCSVACLFDHAGGKRGKKGAVQDIGRKDESDISKLVRMIMARQFDPVRPCVRLTLVSALYLLEPNHACMSLVLHATSKGICDLWSMNHREELCEAWLWGKLQVSRNMARCKIMRRSPLGWRSGCRCWRES